MLKEQPFISEKPLLPMTPNYFNFYFFSLLIFISNAEWNPKDFQKREHSLVKPFTGTL